MPLSAQAMLQIGVKLDADLISAPNWFMFMVVFGVIVGVCVAGILAVLLGNLHGWKVAPVVGDPAYRWHQRRFKIGNYHEHMVGEAKEGTEETGGLRQRTADDMAADAIAMAMAMLDDDSEDEDGEDGAGWARCLRDDDITLSELYERLAAHDRTTHKWYEDSSTQSKLLLSRIRTDLAELQNKVNPALGAASIGFVARAWRREIASRRAYWEYFDSSVSQTGAALKYLFGIVGGASVPKLTDAIRILLDDDTMLVPNTEEAERGRGQASLGGGSTNYDGPDENPFTITKARDTARVLFDLCELTISVERDRYLLHSFLPSSIYSRTPAVLTYLLTPFLLTYRRLKVRAQLVLPAADIGVSPLTPLLAAVNDAEDAQWKEIWRMKEALEGLVTVLEKKSIALERACVAIRHDAQKKALKVTDGRGTRSAAGVAEEKKRVVKKHVLKSGSRVKPALGSMGHAIKVVARRWKHLVQAAHTVLVAEQRAVQDLEDAIWPILADLDEFEEDVDEHGDSELLLDGGGDERDAVAQAVETENEELQRMADRIEIDRTVNMGDSEQQAEAQVQRLETEFHLEGTDAEWLLNEAKQDQAKLEMMLSGQSKKKSNQLQSRLKAKRAQRLKAGNDRRAEQDRVAAIKAQHEAQLQRLREKSEEAMQALAEEEDARDAKEREAHQDDHGVSDGQADLLSKELSKAAAADAKELKTQEERVKAAKRKRGSVELDREREMQKLRLLTRYAARGEREKELLKKKQAAERKELIDAKNHGISGAAELLTKREEAHFVEAAELESRLGSERDVAIEAAVAEIDDLASNGVLTAEAVAQLEQNRLVREQRASIEGLQRALDREKTGKSQALEAKLAKRRAARVEKLAKANEMKEAQRKQVQRAEVAARLEASGGGSDEGAAWLDGVNRALGAGSSEDAGLIHQLEAEQMEAAAELEATHAQGLAAAMQQAELEHARELQEHMDEESEARDAALAALDAERKERLALAPSDTEAMALVAQFDRDRDRKMARFEADAGRRRSKIDRELTAKEEKMIRRIKAEQDLQRANEAKSQAQHLAALRLNASRKHEKTILENAMKEGADVSGDKITAMMKAVVQQRHMQEQVQLAAEQQEQLARELMQEYTKLMATKRHEQAEARAQARATDAGSATVDVAMRKIARRVDDQWRKKETELTKQLDLKHQQQMLALQQRQIGEIRDQTAELMNDMGHDVEESKVSRFYKVVELFFPPFPRSMNDTLGKALVRTT